MTPDDDEIQARIDAAVAQADFSDVPVPDFGTVTPRIPLLVHDDSFTPDPRGYRAWSYEAPNDTLPHPLVVGTIVWTRDLDPDDTECVARIHTVEEHYDRFRYWTYWLLPTPTPVDEPVDN